MDVKKKITEKTDINDIKQLGFLVKPDIQKADLLSKYYPRYYLFLILVPIIHALINNV